MKFEIFVETDILMKSAWFGEFLKFYLNQKSVVFSQLMKYTEWLLIFELRNDRVWDSVMAEVPLEAYQTF